MIQQYLVAGALALAALVDARPSQAYYFGAWCAKLDAGGGVVQERCDFPTFETCRRYAMGQSLSHCVQNPYTDLPRNTEGPVHRRPY